MIALATTLGLAFLAGLAGSAHCIGMCGAFVLAVGRTHPKAAWRAQLVYALGRACAYGFLGAVFALAGGFVVLAAALADAQGYVALGAGLVIVAMALRRLFGGGDPNWYRALPDRLHRMLSAGRGASALFAFGAVNALIPCGLLVTMELRAVSAANVVEGFLLMFAFALGTAPTLVTFGAMGSRVLRSGRAWWDRLASLLLVALGLQVLLRGMAHQGWIAHSSWY
jgi:sulfite exporter TauE/SafE